MIARKRANRRNGYWRMVSAKNPAFLIAGIYAAVGIFWIIFTDWVVEAVIEDIGTEYLFQTIKGILYVLLSTVLIYLLVRIFWRRIREQVTELEAIFSIPEFGALQFDEGGTIRTFTSCVPGYLAYNPGELKGRNLKEVTFPEDWKNEKKQLQKLKSGSVDRVTLELRLKSSLGEYHWVEKVIRMLEGSEHNPVYVAVLRWIDERIEAENQLKEALREKEALINSTQDLIWSIDREMRIVSYNDSYAEAIRLISGLEIHKAHRGIMPEFGEELARKWKEHYQRALSGETLTIFEEHEEKLGKYISEILISPIREGSEIVGASCIARDVTALKQTEANLSAHAERLQEAQRIAKLGDWIFDPVTEEVSWSEEMFVIHERDPELGPVPYRETLEYYLGKEDATRLSRAVEQAVESESGYDLELRLLLPNGKEKFIRAIGIFHRSETGKKSLLRGIVQDVTDFRTLREQLAASQEQLKAVVENIPGVVFQYALYPDGKDKILFVSGGTEKLWGVRREAVLQDNQLIWKQYDSEDIASLTGSIQESAENLTPWHCLWRSNHPDGTTRWHEGFGHPRKQEAGSIIWNSIIIDVTERVHTEKQLQKHERYWALVSKHASDGIIICDPDGKLLYFNETVQKWQGEINPDLEPDEWARAYGLYTLDGSRLLRKEEIELYRALQGETVLNYRHLVKLPGKEPQYVEASGGPLHDDHGNKLGAMVILRDITDRYQQEFEITDAVITAAENERQQIASELHDSIMQELSIISLNLNNFFLEHPEYEKSKRLGPVRKYLEMAMEETRAISHRLMPGLVIDLGLVKAIEEHIEAIAGSSGMEISYLHNVDFRLPDDMAIDVFRILQEALNNVIRHARAKSLTVNLNYTGNKLQLTILDDGIGFAFIDSDEAGPGIGMRTMQNRAKKWHGKFYVESDRNGTIVQVEIPIGNLPK